MLIIVDNNVYLDMEVMHVGNQYQMFIYIRRREQLAYYSIHKGPLVEIKNSSIQSTIYE